MHGDDKYRYTITHDHYGEKPKSTTIEGYGYKVDKGEYGQGSLTVYDENDEVLGMFRHFESWTRKKIKPKKSDIEKSLQQGFDEAA